MPKRKIFLAKIKADYWIRGPDIKIPKNAECLVSVEVYRDGTAKILKSCNDRDSTKTMFLEDFSSISKKNISSKKFFITFMVRIEDIELISEY